jgi:hypothetical protein
MALSTFLLDDRIERRLVKQTAAGTTADNDVVGKAPTIFSIRVKNASSSTAAYAKLYDAKTATNSDNPTMNLRSPANSSVDLHLPDGIVFTNGLCIRAAQEADDTAGATAPESSVTVEILTN